MNRSAVKISANSAGTAVFAAESGSLATSESIAWLPFPADRGRSTINFMLIKLPLLWGCLILILRGDVAALAEGDSPMISAKKSGPSPAWLTGQALRRKLDEPVDLVLSEDPLRSALRRLLETHRVAVFLDPRADPGRKVQLSLQNVPLHEALQKIAQPQNLGAALLGPVVYFGPPVTTIQLRILSGLRTEELQMALPLVRKKFFARAPMAWNDFAEPRELLRWLVRKNGMAPEGIDALPHDLWAAADLPPMTLVERLTLLLAPFGRTFSVSPDGRRLIVSPIPDMLPKVKESGGLSGGHAAEVALDDKRFTLTVEEKPFGPVMLQLAKQIGLQLQLDTEALQRAGVSPEARISFSVKEATIDQLLQAAVQHVPVRWHRQGNSVVIEPLTPEK
jgi:hypothetical protein